MLIKIRVYEPVTFYPGNFSVFNWGDTALQTVPSHIVWLAGRRWQHRVKKKNRSRSLAGCKGSPTSKRELPTRSAKQGPVSIMAHTAHHDDLVYTQNLVQWWPWVKCKWYDLFYSWGCSFGFRMFVQANSPDSYGPQVSARLLQNDERNGLGQFLSLCYNEAVWQRREYKEKPKPSLKPVMCLLSAFRTIWRNPAAQSQSSAP